MQIGLGKRLLAEALGALILTGTVVGSGILAAQLAAGNDAIALIGNTAATGAILFVLISALGPISGAHFNPAVTVVMTIRRELSVSAALLYVPTQVAGCVLGAWLAHAMFDMTIVQWSTHVRSGAGQWLAEAVATAGLLLVILRAPAARAPAMVAAYVGAAYWFTASTSFANPAAAVGRMFSDSFAGIAPASVPGFIAAQLVGAALGLFIHHLLGHD